MSEAQIGYLSKRKITERIAAANKIESHQFIDSCVPTTVAFTHGYSDEEFVMGLHTSTSIPEIEHASKILAKKYGERVVEKSFHVPSVQHSFDHDSSVQHFFEELDETLKASRATWILYYMLEAKHIIGVLNEGENKYLLWDTSNSKRVTEVGAHELAGLVLTEHKDRTGKIYIFGFSK